MSAAERLIIIGKGGKEIPVPPPVTAVAYWSLERVRKPKALALEYRRRAEKGDINAYLFLDDLGQTICAHFMRLTLLHRPELDGMNPPVNNPEMLAQYRRKTYAVMGWLAKLYGHCVRELWDFLDSDDKKAVVWGEPKEGELDWDAARRLIMEEANKFREVRSNLEAEKPLDRT